MDTKLLYRADEGFIIQVFAGIGCHLYEQLLRVRYARSNGNQPIAHSYDEYSDHYLASHDGQPIGCLTVNRASEGPLDCEEFYPPVLLETYRDVLVSSCNLKVVPSDLGRSSIGTIFRIASRDQVDKGNRLDIINATGRLIPIYQKRFGYRLAGRSFVHPRLKTPSEVLYLQADSGLKDSNSPILAGIVDPLPNTEVRNCLDGKSNLTLNI